ncbi:MAG: hypothetical protein U0746_21620 [Gemmataceae bacterium]
MRTLYLLFLLAFGGAVAAFAYFNAGEVEVRFFDRTLSASLAAVVGVAYALGMLSGWTVVGLVKRSIGRVTEPYYRVDERN